MLTVEYQDYEQKDKNESFDITSLILNMRLSTSVAGQAGKIDISIVADKNVRYHNGGKITVIDGNSKIFLGYIFKLTGNEDAVIKIIAYDQIRYLKNQDVYISKNDTLETLFSNLCKRFSLSYKILDKANSTLPTKIYDNKSLYDIIDIAIGLTIQNEQKRFVLWDNFGTLELFNAESQMTDYCFGDDNLVFGYTFTKSIDKDTYNQIKYSQENKELAVRQNYIIYNSQTVKRWGTLQYFKTISGSATRSQILTEMYNRLKLHNHENRELKFSALGNWDIRAGKGIWILLTTDLEDVYIQRGLVSNCIHTLEGSFHTMELTVEVPRDESYEKIENIEVLTE